MNKLSRVGIDLAKNVFQLHGVDRNEQTVWRRRLTRGKWLKVLLKNVEPGCEVGMEACAGAHHWARQLQAKGFAVMKRFWPNPFLGRWLKGAAERYRTYQAAH